MPHTVHVDAPQKRLWRAKICLWTLAVACLIYIACIYMPYLHIVNDKHCEIRQKKCLSQSSDHVRGGLKFLFNNTVSKNLSINGTVTRSLQHLERPSLFLTLSGLHIGRLGNQMFRYASLLGIAHRLNRTPFINPGFSLGVVFNLSHLAEIPESESWPVINHNLYGTFETTLLDNLLSEEHQHKNLTIRGYLQSWKFFRNIPETIRTEFLFRPPVLKQRDKILTSVLPLPRHEMILVGVHVRRSDLLLSSSVAMGYTVPERSYFFKAFQRMRWKYSGRKVVFLVASDDFSWCEKNLRGVDVVIMGPASHAVHLALLTSCDHVIFSTGTFGWWGAWLAGGDVVYYKNYPRHGTNLSKGFSRDDFFPSHWVGIGD